VKAGYLGALLRGRLGRGFKELLQEARLERAASLLASTDASVEAVAREIGYSNLSFFYSLFRERYGQTPAAFRRGSGQAPLSR